MNQTDASPLDLLAAYRDAVLNKDLNAFVGLYAPDLRAFDAWDRWCSDRAEWRAMAETWFESLGAETVEVRFEEVRCDEAENATGEGLAAISARVHYTAISASGERLRSVCNRFTAVLTRSESRWRILHEHTSVPVEFTQGRAIPYTGGDPTD